MKIAILLGGLVLIGLLALSVPATQPDTMPPPLSERDQTARDILQLKHMLCQFRRGNVLVYLGDSSVSGRLEFADVQGAFLAYEPCKQP